MKWRAAMKSMLCMVLACNSPGATSRGPETAAGDGFHRRFEDAHAWSKTFDDPARDAWQRPEEVLNALGIQPDMRFADIGAGTGYFAARIAKRVPNGLVYAIDVEPDMVRFLGERAKKEGLTNLVPVQSSIDDARIPEPVDVILVVDVYHHLSERVAYVRSLARHLRPGGRLVIIDFTAQSPIGPPPVHRISVDRAQRELAEAGYTLVDTRALPNQYCLSFQHPPP